MINWMTKKFIKNYDKVNDPKVREKYGAGWASSYAGSYDPYDAGKYYGASDCIDTSLFDTKGHPLESLKTFLYVRYGTKE